MVCDSHSGVFLRDKQVVAVRHHIYIQNLKNGGVFVEPAQIAAGLFFFFAEQEQIFLIYY